MAMLLDFVCWNCRSKLYVKRFDNGFGVECQGADYVCSTEGIGPVAETEELAIEAYGNTFKEWMDKKNIRLIQIKRCEICGKRMLRCPGTLGVKYHCLCGGRFPATAGEFADD